MTEDNDVLRRSDLLEVKYEIAAWILCLLSLVLYVSTSFLWFKIVTPFTSMFSSLGGALPDKTVYLLKIGDPWIGVILLVLALSPLLLCKYVPNAAWRMKGNAILLFVHMFFIKFVLSAIFSPLLEAQAALS